MSSVAAKRSLQRAALADSTGIAAAATTACLLRKTRLFTEPSAFWDWLTRSRLEVSPFSLLVRAFGL
jgi:hypothetical protein